MKSTVFQLLNEGKTYKQIGEELGMTRSAVAGKVYRWRREQPTAINVKKKEKKETIKKVAKTTIKKQKAPTKRKIVSMPLLYAGEEHCKEIIGNSNTPFPVCCGVRTIEGSSYCEKHHKINHTLVSDPSKQRSRLAPRQRAVSSAQWTEPLGR